MTIRRRVLGLLLLPLVLVLSSCLRMQSTYTIKDIENVEVSINFGIQKQYAQGEAGSVNQMCQQDMMPAGTTIEKYDDNQYVGCTAKGTVKVSDVKEITFDEASQVWSFAMMPDSKAESEGIASTMISDFKISVTFPGKVLTNSGKSKVSGTTVTWTDPNDLFSAEGLKATAQHGAGGGSSLTWLWIALGVLGLAAIGAGIFFAMKNKKKAQPSQQFTQQSWQQPQDQQAWQQPSQQPWQQPQDPQAWQQPQGQEPWQQQGQQAWQQPQDQPWQPQAGQGYQPPAEQAWQPSPAAQPEQTYQPPAEQTWQPSPAAQPEQTYQPPAEQTWQPSPAAQPEQTYQPPAEQTWQPSPAAQPEQTYQSPTVQQPSAEQPPAPPADPYPPTPESQDPQFPPQSPPPPPPAQG